VALVQRVVPAAGGGHPVRTTSPDGTAWVASGAPGWWTVALVNWDDEPRAIAVTPAALGITGRRFAVYDVWKDAPLPDVTTQVAVTIPPRTALTLALRAGAARPQVIGTTRHVIQGAVDVADETWDAATRTLRGRAVRRDGRVYRVTIAVPASLRPAACESEPPPCTMQRLPSGHVTLEWPAATPPPEEMAWLVRFRTVTSR